MNNYKFKLSSGHTGSTDIPREEYERDFLLKGVTIVEWSEI